MDLMFEDEVDEVGSDIEAYCPKCKADTTHVVISKYEDEIRRVQCNPCGDVHSFRKPRGEVEDDMPEPVSARKRALMKKPDFEEFFAKKKSTAEAPVYEFRRAYRENEILTHPKFGLGFVSEIVSDSKVEATFKDGRRVLVHNRKDIPGIPKGDGVPLVTLPKAPAAKVEAPAAAKAGKADSGKVEAAKSDAPKAAGKDSPKVEAKVGKGESKVAAPAAETKAAAPAKKAAVTAPTKKPEVSAKKSAAPAQKPAAVPAQKPAAAPAKKPEAPAKKSAPPTPAKKSEAPAKKPAAPAPAKKPVAPAPVKKPAPAKKPEPAKKAAPAKKPEPAKKAAPAAPAKKPAAAPAKKPAAPAARLRK